jgi:hypothetical protein
MHNRAMRGVLVVAALFGLFASFGAKANCGALPGTEAIQSSLNPPAVFESVSELNSYFEQHGVVAKSKLIQGHLRALCFVWDDPFSGVDTTLLSCYVISESHPVLFLRAVLRKTLPNSVSDFVVDGDFVDVVCKGQVILKINPPN